MLKHFPDFVKILAVFALVLATDGAFAGGFTKPSALSEQALQGHQSLIQRVHGFHCREEFGWNPATGYYEHHKHLGICANLGRCTQEQKRCLRVYGRGWNKWEFIRWGFNNRVYQACMIRAGCY